MADIKVLDRNTPVSVSGSAQKETLRSVVGAECPDSVGRTLIPSCEKQGGTAELSSSASLRRIGNFSTADMGISPR